MGHRAVYIEAYRQEAHARRVVVTTFRLKAKSPRASACLKNTSSSFPRKREFRVQGLQRLPLFKPGAGSGTPLSRRTRPPRLQFGGGDDPLPADEIGEAKDALGDELGMTEHDRISHKIPAPERRHPGPFYSETNPFSR